MNKKTIWITGGSTGIGRALAIKFANEGWNVAVSARRTELLNELKKVNFKNLFHLFNINFFLFFWIPCAC